MKKRGQAWGLDILVATVIFISAIITFYLFALNTGSQGESITDEMNYQASSIADSLLSQGNPADWNENNVVKIGLVTNEKINQTKLEKFNNLSESQYQHAQALFNTRFNYFINFSVPMEISSQVQQGIGKAPANAENIMRVTRFTIYKNEPTTMYVLVWN